MKGLLVLLLIVFHSQTFARPDQGLERINFYPAVDAYAIGGYRYQHLDITTPKTSVDTNEVENYQNIFSLTYAYNFDWFFLGFKAAYEMATESAVISGVPSGEKFTSQGFKNTEYFLHTRFRKQKEDKGNIDGFFSFSDNISQKEVGESSSNRKSGRNIFQAVLSHGYIENEWEFKNSISWIFLDEGEEYNHFVQKEFDMRSYNMFTYKFTGQYAFNQWNYLNAFAGFRYRTVQKIANGASDKREIQAGTGSLFGFGYQKPLSSRSLVELIYELERYTYFVKGTENFDGEATQNSIELNLKKGF